MENTSELTVKYKIFSTQYSSNNQPITVKKTSIKALNR